MPRLATFVHVRNASGVHAIFGPDDEVPEWAIALITNPAAWTEPPTSVRRLTEPATPSPAKRAAPRKRTVTTRADAV